MATNEKRILICPKCGSTAIAPHVKNGHKIKHGDIFEAYYGLRVCEKCGYSGHFFPDIPVNMLKQIRAEIKKLRKSK